MNKKIVLATIGAMAIMTILLASEPVLAACSLCGTQIRPYTVRFNRPYPVQFNRPYPVRFSSPFSTNRCNTYTVRSAQPTTGGAFTFPAFGCQGVCRRFAVE